MSPKRNLEIGSAVALATTVLLAAIAWSYFQRQSERLARAVEQFDPAEAIRLLKAGADPNSTFQGNPALVIAAQRDQMHPVIQELIVQGANLEARNSEGETALHAAAVCGSMGEVQTLLAAGASPNTADQDGNTPLHLAHTHTEVLELLLQHGADVNALNKWGRTPLQEAKRHLLEPPYSGHVEDVQLTIRLFEKHGGR